MEHTHKINLLSIVLLYNKKIQFRDKKISGEYIIVLEILYWGCVEDELLVGVD